MEGSRDAVRRFRLHALGLAKRRSDGDAPAAAAPGLRDTPAGAFRDALAARLASAATSSGRFDGEEAPKRRVDDGLVAIWGPRGAPYVAAAADLGVFTRGALPVDEASARVFAPSAVKALDLHGVSFLDAFAQVEAAMRAAVAEGPVERDAMHQRLRGTVRPELLWPCKGCGTDHVHPMVWRAACTMGAVRREEAGSRAVTYAAVAEPPAPADDAAARKELTRRALHHHGPLTAKELATWLSVSGADVRGRLEALAPELDEVERGGTSAFALRADRDALADPPPVTGVRLLGAGDPLLDGRDRATIIADPAAQKEVWKLIANPGVVLADGRVVGTWRAKATARRLDVTLTALGGARLPAAGRLQPEADALAAIRGRQAANIINA